MKNMKKVLGVVLELTGLLMVEGAGMFAVYDSVFNKKENMTNYQKGISYCGTVAVGSIITYAGLKINKIGAELVR